jgi:hypothetical protein
MTEPVQSQNTLLRSVRDQAKAWINRVRVGRAQFASSLPQNSVGYGPLSYIGEGGTVATQILTVEKTNLLCLSHDAPAMFWQQADGAPSFNDFLLNNGSAWTGQVSLLASGAGAPAVLTIADRSVAGFPVEITWANDVTSWEGSAGYLANTPVVNGRVRSQVDPNSASNPEWYPIWLRSSDLTAAMIDDGYEFTVNDGGTFKRYRIIGLWYDEQV